MSALIIDGKALSKKILSDLTIQVGVVQKQIGRPPTLAVVLVGDNPASKVYVAAKTKNAKNCGIQTVDVFLPKDISQSVLEDELRKLNDDCTVDGILLQLPLPHGLDEFKALKIMSPVKDADGLHPENQGMLMRGAPAPIPCTPHGVMKLIDYAITQLGRSDSLSGLKAVVVGRSVLVGKPVALMLLERNCTVTMCHSKTRELRAECAWADILVGAVGRPKIITKEFVKPGAIVIDVGINRLESGALVGDVDFDTVKEVCGAITPVPGGVGPMTIAMLLTNTVKLASLKALS